MGLKNLDSSLIKVEIDSKMEGIGRTNEKYFYELPSRSKDRNKRRRQSDLLQTQKSVTEEDDFDPGVSRFFCDVAEEDNDDEDYEIKRPPKKRQKEKGPRSTEILKPFKCSRCSTRYSCLLTFNAHKRKVHKSE